MSKNLIKNVDTSMDFEEAINNFYTKLLYNQKSLGEEFEKILYENLWDLYQVTHE